MALGKERKLARVKVLRQAAAWVADIDSTYMYDQDSDKDYNLIIEESKSLSVRLFAQAEKLESTI